MMGVECGAPTCVKNLGLRLLVPAEEAEVDKFPRFGTRVTYQTGEGRGEGMVCAKEELGAEKRRKERNHPLALRGKRRREEETLAANAILLYKRGRESQSDNLSGLEFAKVAFPAMPQKIFSCRSRFIDGRGACLKISGEGKERLKRKRNFFFRFQVADT